MGILTQTRHKIKRSLQASVNKKPAYRIHRNGVEVKYFDFTNTDELPFDKETYQETQVFLGKWCNPWYIDFDAIEDEYPNFEKEEITTVKDVFAKKHVWPSQRWKILANQNALNNMFMGSVLSNERIIRLLYLVAAGIGFVLLLILFGGV